MKLLKKVCKQIIWTITFLYCLYLMALGYFASLLIVKPRNISFLNDFIYESLSAIDSNIALRTQYLSLEWNKANYSIILKASENHIQHNQGTTIYLPEIIIEINRTGLFFANLKINNIIANDAVINLKPIAKTKVDKTNRKIDLTNNVTLHDKMMDFHNFIRNLSLENLSINYDNNKTIKNDLILSSHQNYDKIYFRLKNKTKQENQELFLHHNCTATINTQEVLCQGKTNLLNSKFLTLFGLPIIGAESNFNTILTYDTITKSKLYYFDKINFTLASNQAGNLRLTNITNQIDFSSLLINGSLDKDIDLDFRIGLKDENLTGNFYATDLNQNNVFKRNKENFKNATYNLQISGNNLHSSYISKLWPLKPGKKVRKFLIDNVDATVENFALKFLLKRNQEINKHLIEQIDLNLKLKQGNIIYSGNFPAIRNASAEIKLTKDNFNMVIKEANAGEVSLTNASINIPTPFQQHKKLHISSHLTGHPNSYLIYLFKNIMSPEKLSNLKETLNFDGSIDGNIKLGIPLKKKIEIEDLDILAKLKLDNFLLKNYLNDSSLNLNLQKKYRSKDFNVELSCMSCNIENDFFNYYEKENSEHKFFTSFKIDDGKTILQNFALNKNNKTLIKGSGIIGKSGFSDFAVNINDFGRNKLSVTFDQKGNDIFYDIEGETLDLTNILKSSNGNSKTNSVINGKINNVILPLQQNLTNVQIASKYIDKQNFLSFITGKFNNNNFINISQSITKEGKRIIIESDNIGYLANMLNISDRLDSGNSRIELHQKQNQTTYHGKLRAYNFIVKEIDFLHAVKNIEIFKHLKKTLETNKNIEFKQATADFKLTNNQIIINDFVSYSKPLGITGKGSIKLKEQELELKGVLVPAYQINRLFGIADIPVIGKMITGGSGEGIISPQYKITGTFSEPKFNINPLSVVTPGFIRNIFSFSLSQTINNSEQCLKTTPENLIRADFKGVVANCNVMKKNSADKESAN